VQHAQVEPSRVRETGDRRMCTCKPASVCDGARVLPLSQISSTLRRAAGAALLKGSRVITQCGLLPQSAKPRRADHEHELNVVHVLALLMTEMVISDGTC